MKCVCKIKKNDWNAIIFLREFSESTYSFFLQNLSTIDKTNQKNLQIAANKCLSVNVYVVFVVILNVLFALFADIYYLCTQLE
jgi:uncharacterized membrane protein YqhA